MENLELLKFIKDNQDLINRIKLTSDNDSLKQFLLINKTSKAHRQIEFFPFRSPTFKGNSSFFQEIFDKVTKNNGILINKNTLDKNQEYSIKINIVYKKYTNIFEYVEINERETDMEIISESPVNPKTSIENGIENEEDEYEDENIKWVKKGLIPNFKRNRCMLSKLRPTFEKYDLIYVNFNELQNLEGDVEEEDFFELMNFFKKKKSKIFVNYYKSIKSEIVEPPDEETDEDEGEYDDNYNKESKDEKIKSNNENDNNENKISENENNNNKEKSNDEKSKNSKKFSNQNSLNKLFDISDIYFFDENQAYQLFDRHLKYSNDKKTVNTLNKSKIYDYFISSIAGNEKNSEEKIGLFLNELGKFTIVIICSQKKEQKKQWIQKYIPKKRQEILKRLSCIKN